MRRATQQDRTKANLAASAVALRSTRLGLIEKVMGDFDVRLNGFTKKSLVSELFEKEANLYGDKASAEINPIWAREGFSERIFDPGVSPDSIKKTLNIIRSMLANGNVPKLTPKTSAIQNAIKLMKEEADQLNEERLGSWVAHLTPKNWEDYWHNAIGLLNAITKLLQTLEALLLRLQQNGDDLKSLSDRSREHYNRNDRDRCWDDDDDDDILVNHLLWQYVLEPMEVEEASRVNEEANGSYDNMDQPFVDDAPGAAAAVGVGAVGVGAAAIAEEMSNNDIPSEAEAGAYS